MRLKRLEVSGLTRFASPVAVDFEALGPGIIALRGPNGAGKTTLLEASGAGALYRVLPSRGLDLKDAMRPGGVVDLVFDLAGDEYHCRHTLAKSGMTSCLWRGGEQLVAGKVSEYDVAIDRLFGPRRVMLSTVFSPQRDPRRQMAFADMQVGERRGLFRALLGLDRLQALADHFGGQLKAIDTRRLTDLDARVAESTTAKAELHKAADAAAKAAKVAQRTATTATVKAETIAAAFAAAAVARRYDDALDAVVDARAELEALCAPQPPPVDRPVPGALEAAQQALQDAAVAGAHRTAAINAATTALTAARSELERVEEQQAVISAVPCRAEGGYGLCPFLTEAKEAGESLPVLRQRADDLAGALEKLRKSPAPAPPDKGATIVLRQAVDAWTRYDRDCERHASDVKRSEARVAAAEAKAMELAAGAGDASGDVGPTQDEVLSAQAAARAASSMAAEAREQLAAAQARYDLACREESRLLAERAKLARECADVPPLRLLVDALGPQGIQALAIAQAGPGVSDIANELLDACFDGRFQVEVETLRTLKDGRQAETCELRVIDTVWGQVHDSLVAGPSGGEGVVVDEALRLALCLHTLRTARVRWQTLWKDETVGQLDAVAVGRYTELLRRACDLGGIHQALVVSHSEAVGLAADATLEVTAGGEVVAQ